MEWVVKTIQTCCCSLTRLMTRQRFLQLVGNECHSLLVFGSNPVVGSSRNATAGFPTSAIATHNLRFCPPESCTVNRFLSGTSSKHSNDRPTSASSADGGTPLSRE